MLGKLLGVATVGSSFASVALLHRFLSSIVSLILLTVVCAFMLCGILAGGFVLAYLCMIHNGIDSFTAGITLGVVALAAGAGLILAVVMRLKSIQQIPAHKILNYASDMPDLGSLATAFIDGFLSPRRRDDARSNYQ